MNLPRIVAIAALLTGLSHAQTPILVDTTWLSTHLQDPHLVLLQLDSESGYETQHIPGARRISLQDVSLPMTHEEGKLVLELPPAEELRTKFAALGVSDNSHIVVYFANDQYFSASTRVLFTLDYLGLGDHTSLLNGGLPAWIKAGKPTTGVATVIAPGKLTARPTRNVVADAELVKSIGQHPGYRLIDARDAVYYKGVEPTQKKAGHIPGATNIPFDSIADVHLVIDPAHVAEIFKTAGVKPGDTVVAYCHIGQQATAIVFAARLLGNPVMLYDGSFQDWAINNRGPVEK